MTDKDAFEEHLKENKYDQTTRLVFADWLEENGLDDEALYQRQWTPQKQNKIDAEEWLKSFSETTPYSYNEVLGLGHDFETSENLLNNYKQETKDKYWECWELLTGEEKPDPEGSYSSACGCGWQEEDEFGGCSC